MTIVNDDHDPDRPMAVVERLIVSRDGKVRAADIRRSMARPIVRLPIGTDRSSKYNHPDPALKSKPSNPVLPIHASNVVAMNKERPRRIPATATRERIPGVIAALHRQD
jgi:hypothetical protein